MPDTILLVGNTTADRLTIQYALSDYVILTAHNTREALNKIQERHDIDLLILHPTVPAEEERQFIYTVRHMEEYKHLRFIIIVDEDYKEEDPCLKKSVEYVIRPYCLENLKLRVRMLLQLQEIQRNFDHLMKTHDMTLEAILNQAPVGIAIVKSDVPITVDRYYLSMVNPVYEKITGRSRGELLKNTITSITHPEDVVQEGLHLEQLQSGLVDSYTMEKRYIKPDGSIVWVQLVTARLDLNNHSDYSHICIVQDITKQKAFEEELYESERSKSVLLKNLLGMAYRCLFVPEYTMTFVSEGVYDVTGYKSENLINNKDLSFSDLIVPEYRVRIWNEWLKAIKNKTPFKQEYEIITKNGERKWVWEMGQGIFGQDGKVEALEGIVVDISDRKEQELRVQYLIEHDNVTGLYNRNRLEELLTADKGRSGKRALVKINLSKIHLLTITYGYNYSTELTQKVAKALSSLCSEECMLFSTHSSRFLFYVKDYRGKQDLMNLCDRIFKTLSPILLIEGVDIGVGILEIVDPYQDNDSALKNVLFASEEALNRSNQGYSYAFFDEDMEMTLIRREAIKDVLDVIAQGDEERFFLVYQPIIDVKTGRIAFFEALMRIFCPELGTVSPNEFIPVAEETKLIVPIGKLIFTKAFHFLNKINEAGGDLTGITVNVSAIQLLRDEFIPSLIELLEQTSIPPSRLMIEITESTYMDNYREINKKIKALKSLGMKVAVDDFGTGYSSLIRVRELEVDCLKIDKSIIHKISYLDPKKVITGDIVSMTHKLDCFVVAEGVEVEKQKQYLYENHCDMIQGYLISKPLYEQETIEFMKNWHRQQPECSV
jgi:PAS domain S-box-containing protein